MVDDFRPLTLGDRALTRSSINLYGVSYDLATLDREEVNIFNAQFPTLLAAPGSVTRAIQLERVPQYIMAIRMVKTHLDRRFRGLNPEDSELGMQPIRPQFTHDPDTATYRVSWVEPTVAATWVEFLGDGVATPYALPREFGMVMTHLTSLVTPTPLTCEVQINTGRTQLVPIDTRDLAIGDNLQQVAVIPIPTMYWTPDDTCLMYVLSDTGGNINLKCGGLIIGLGRRLNERAPAW